MATFAGPERSASINRFSKFPESNGKYDNSPDYVQYRIEYWDHLEKILDDAQVPQTLIEIAQEFGDISVLRRRKFQRFYRNPHVMLLRKGPLIGYSTTSVFVNDSHNEQLDSKPPILEIWTSTPSGYHQFAGEVKYLEYDGIPVNKKNLANRVKELSQRAYPNTHFSHVYAYGPLHAEKVSWDDALACGKFYQQLYH